MHRSQVIAAVQLGSSGAGVPTPRVFEVLCSFFPSVPLPLPFSSWCLLDQYFLTVKLQQVGGRVPQRATLDSSPKPKNNPANFFRRLSWPPHHTHPHAPPSVIRHKQEEGFWPPKLRYHRLSIFIRLLHLSQ